MSKKRKKYEYPLNYYAPSGDPDQLRKVVKARFSVLTSLELLQMLDALIEETPQNKALVTLLFLLTERLTYGEYGISQIDEIFEKEVIPLAQKIEDISSKISTREITQNIINRIIPDKIDTDSGDNFSDELKQLKDILRDASVKLSDTLDENTTSDPTIKDLIESANGSDDWIEKITEALDRSFKDNDLAGEIKSRLHDKDKYETKKVEDKDYNGYLKFINLIFDDEENDTHYDLLNTNEIKQILDSFDIPTGLLENIEDHEIKPSEGNVKPKEKDKSSEEEKETS